MRSISTQEESYGKDLWKIYVIESYVLACRSGPQSAVHFDVERDLWNRSVNETDKKGEHTNYRKPCTCLQKWTTHSGPFRCRKSLRKRSMNKTEEKGDITNEKEPCTCLQKWTAYSGPFRYWKSLWKRTWMSGEKIYQRELTCMRSISTYMSAAAFCARLFCVLRECVCVCMYIYTCVDIDIDIDIDMNIAIE